MYLKLLLELASRQKKSCITQKMMDALRNVALPFNLTRLLKQFVYILKAQQVKETLTH